MLAKPFWLHLYALGIYAFMYIPIFVLVFFSFEKSRLAVKFTGFTFDWYLKLFHNDDIGLALANSLIVAVLAVLVSSVMGTMAAVGLTRLHLVHDATTKMILEEKIFYIGETLLHR